MITINNYYSEIRNIDFTNLPEALKKGKEFVDKATGNGQNWDSYQSSETIKKTIDVYLAKLNEFAGSNKAGKKQAKEKDKSEDKKTKDEIKVRKGTAQKETKSPKQKIVPQDTEKFQPVMVERVPEELRFIKRFVNLNGKIKTKEEILRFINSLQKAILEKRIRKTSNYAEQILFIQGKLIDLYNSMKAKIRIELKPDTYETLKKVTGEEKVMPSVNFIKRYIGMNGKLGMKEKAKQLLEQINRAMDKGKLSDNDPYITEIHEIKKNLKLFTATKAQKTLEIEKAELNGLEGILGCACQQLNGFEYKPAVMNSMDFANLEFDTLGFTGKWLDLIGDPSSNFTAMVFGKPKFGKSTLCVEFAGYLARHHGKVLYVAKEEGLDMTLQKKLHDKNVMHPNLYVASELPQSLSSYDFIFLDSVNKLGLNPEDLNQLRANNPSKSFIFIFQSTKGGEFRGANSFQHDVDVVIEVPEWGKAVQMGRFNQGGEMRIFNVKEAV